MGPIRFDVKFVATYGVCTVLFALFSPIIISYVIWVFLLIQFSKVGGGFVFSYYAYCIKQFYHRLSLLALELRNLRTILAGIYEPAPIISFNSKDTLLKIQKLEIQGHESPLYYMLETISAHKILKSLLTNIETQVKDCYDKINTEITISHIPDPYCELIKSLVSIKNCIFKTPLNYSTLLENYQTSKSFKSHQPKPDKQTCISKMTKVIEDTGSLEQLPIETKFYYPEKEFIKYNTIAIDELKTNHKVSNAKVIFKSIDDKGTIITSSKSLLEDFFCTELPSNLRLKTENTELKSMLTKSFTHKPTQSYVLEGEGELATN
jgi:hypothetical protein